MLLQFRRMGKLFYADDWVLEMQEPVNLKKMNEQQVDFLVSS